MLELAVTGSHQAAMAIATRGRGLQLRQQPPGPWEMGLPTVSQLNTSVSLLLLGGAELLACRWAVPAKQQKDHKVLDPVCCQ